MFDKTRGFFSTASDYESDISTEADDLRMAVISLLVSAAKADSQFSQVEFDAIVNIASSKLGLGRKEVNSLLTASEDFDIVSETIREINLSFNSSQRQQVFSFVCSIFNADGVIKDSESIFLAKLQSDLDLTLEQAVASRKRAADCVVDGFKEFVEASPEVIRGTKVWAQGSKDLK